MQTLDIVSGGRVEFGIGASWLEEEWVAAGLDFATRGRRVDEAIAVCQRLWAEPEVEHHGEFFSFPPVAFEPKPVQRPHPPVLVGGESKAALRRAARDADGWIGMGHTFESAAAQINGSTSCARSTGPSTGSRAGRSRSASAVRSRTRTTCGDGRTSASPGSSSRRGARSREARRRAAPPTPTSVGLEPPADAS